MLKLFRYELNAFNIQSYSLIINIEAALQKLVRQGLQQASIEIISTLILFSVSLIIIGRMAPYLRKWEMFIKIRFKVRVTRFSYRRLLFLCKYSYLLRYNFESNVSYTNENALIKNPFLTRNLFLFFNLIFNLKIYNRDIFNK